MTKTKAMLRDELEKTKKYLSECNELNARLRSSLDKKSSLPSELEDANNEIKRLVNLLNYYKKEKDSANEKSTISLSRILDLEAYIVNMVLEDFKGKK